MPHCDRARRRMHRQVSVKPIQLGGASAAGNHRAVAVEDNEVPGSEIEAVVAFGGVACSRTEVIEIVDCTGDVVFMVAGRGNCSRPVATPCQVVTFGEGSVCAIGVRKIACHKNGTRNRIEQLGRGLGIGQFGGITNSDVASSDYHRILSVRHRIAARTPDSQYDGPDQLKADIFLHSFLLQTCQKRLAEKGEVTYRETQGLLGRDNV